MKFKTSGILDAIFGLFGKLYWIVIIILLLNGCAFDTSTEELVPLSQGKTAENSQQ